MLDIGVLKAVRGPILLTVSTVKSVPKEVTAPPVQPLSKLVLKVSTTKQKEQNLLPIAPSASPATTASALLHPVPQVNALRVSFAGKALSTQLPQILMSMRLQQDSTRLWDLLRLFNAQEVLTKTRTNNQPAKVVRQVITVTLLVWQP